MGVWLSGICWKVDWRTLIFGTMSSSPDRGPDGPSRQRKTALFIDGANLHATGKALGFRIDYRLLLQEFESRGAMFRAFYYTPAEPESEFSPIKPLLNWLDYNGYAVVAQLIKACGGTLGERMARPNTHVQLAVDAMELAESVDQMVLFSGD